MSMVFTHADQITPAWLTELLRTQGVLTCDEVLAVEGTTKATLLASVGQLAVRYSPNADPDAPTRLFLKTGLRESADEEDFQAEVFFYQQIAPQTPQSLRCYHAAYAAQPARFHLLLESLAETHSTPTWPLPPTHAQAEQAIDYLAQLHAAWWEHPQLGQTIMPRFRETTLDRWLPVWEQQLAHFLDVVGDRITPRRHQLYRWALPRLLEQILARRRHADHYTLAHQDAHPYNVLFPRNPAQHSARLIDWATWDVELGARDLAYFVALHLPAEQRALVEQPLLRRYHAQLQTRGVVSYPWQQLWDDYRLCVVWNMFIPVEQCYWQLPPAVWWWHVERSLVAFDDLKCLELLP